MKIFKQIEDGIIPDKNLIIGVLKNNYKEKNDENKIKKYISVLEKAYFQSSSLYEKLLINEVIFLLNLISTSQKEAIYDYLDRFLVLNVHEVAELTIKKDSIELFSQVVEFFGVENFIEYVNSRLLIADNWKKDELRSFLNWILHKVWNIPLFHNNSTLTGLYDNLKSLLYKLIAQNRTDEVMYLEFFIYHLMGNIYQTQKEWRKFNEEISKVCAEHYKKYGEENKLKKPHPTEKEKKRIAIIRDRLVENSPFIVEYSLLKRLQQNKNFTDNYEVAVYSMNYFEKSFDSGEVVRKLRKINIPVISPAYEFVKERYYNNHLEKAIQIRKTLIEDDIDIMIGVVNGYDIMNFLFATRTAPKQIYWSHGNCAYDVPGIDERISHFEQECKEFEWKIFNVPFATEFLIGTEEDKKEAEKLKKNFLKTFGKDTVILGTIGRLIKIDSDEYLKTIAKIMEQNKNTIYLACGLGNKKTIENKLDKYGVNKKRFIFTDEINPHIYGWVIDVWPDTFPLREGQSKNEYTAKGGVVVYMNKYLNDTVRNWYKNFEIKPYADSVDDYIAMVTEFINNPDKRKKLGEFNKNIFSDESIDKFLDVI